MEDAVTSNDPDYIYMKDVLDQQMFREEETTHLNDRQARNSGVGHQDSIANNPNRLSSTIADMKQGVRDPGSSNIPKKNPSTSDQESRCAVSRRIKSGFVSRSTFQFAQNCKSPSTDSTTSLAQLRDKLTVLPPLKYNKVTRKIASSPELPVLNETEEFENLSSSSLSKTKCGAVSLKYYSDSEAQAKIIKNKTRCLPTVVEEHSASLVLVAALDNTDQTVTNETFEELYRNNPNIDLVDLLVVEAFQHGQEKDSGIISGKVTQETDVVENTPVEYVRHKEFSLKQNTKTVVQDAPAIDDDEVDVIEDTPCYVYDRRERVRTKIMKASKVVPDAIVPLDATTIDSFFSQHGNENNIENIISPTLARKINASSSEGSDDECLLVEDQFFEKEISVSNLAFEADIYDCVNSIVDKVCSDLDKCADLLGQQERQIDNLRLAKNIDKDSNISSDIFNTSKDSKRKLKSKKKIYEHNPDVTQKVSLKFNQSVKVVPKMNTRKKTAKSDKDRIDIGKSDVLIESTNTTPPVKSTKSTLIRKKRKLYSPKDDENENNEIRNLKTTAERRLSNINQTPLATCYRELENARKSHNRVPETSRASTQEKQSNKKTRYSAYSDAEDPPFQVGKRTSTTSIGSTTTMSRRERPANPVDYTDYWPSSSEDNEHNITIKPKTVRKNKARRGKVERTSRNQPILSPKTKKLNEMFDKIKDNIVNDEKITIVEKKSLRKDLSLYNLSSESEDGDFKKKKIQVQKRVSSSSIDSSATKRRKLSSVKYSENSSEDEGKRTLKLKTVKKGKPRSRKRNKIPKLNLSDERMRVAQQETLETSFVKEKANANNLEVPAPALQQTPVLEFIPPDKSNDDVVEAEGLENKSDTAKKLNISKIKKENNSSKKSPKVTRSTVTKSKENIKELSKERDSATVSPLPGLVVETERTRIDDLPSSVEANLLQKLKKMYTEEECFNEDDTRNMLLNADENDNAVCEPTQMIETELVLDEMSEKSIATVGRSPITGHNDQNESPPNVELLDEDFQHRDVHNEGMSESIAEFLGNMRNQLQTSRSTTSQTSAVIPITRISTKESARSNLCAKRMSSKGSVKSVSNAESNKSNPKVVLTRVLSPEIESKTNPIGTPKSKASVVLTRMSSDEIEKYLTPTRTRKSSNTGSPEIVIDRISSDEINKWLPMPEFKNKASDEKPKKYNTRQTSKAPQIKLSPNIVEKKIKPNISPVKLTFDIVDLTRHRVTKELRTRSSTKSMKSHTNTNKEPLQTGSIESSKAKTSKKDQNLLKDSQETIPTVTTRSKPDNQNQKKPISVDASDINKSIASVQDWFQRNATSSSPSAADNNNVKEVLCHVMEALQTTLAEIHHDTGERLTAMFLKDQEDITSIEKEMQRLQEMIATFKKEKVNRACEVIRDDAEKKARMIQLLQEDIQNLLEER